MLYAFLRFPTFLGVCSNELACQNGGYIDPNACYRCKCPEGYDGTRCQALAYSSKIARSVFFCVILDLAECEGIDVYAVQGWRWVKSPTIQAGMNCYWRIKVRTNEKDYES